MYKLMVCVSRQPDRPLFTTFTISSDWLSSETPNSLLLGTARLRQRRKLVGWVRCQGMHEGFENDPGNRQECIQKLVEKSAGSAYIICSTVIPMECHVVPSPCIRCVAKLSGCGAFYRLQQSLYQSKNLILPTASAAVFILWDFRCY